MQSQRIPMQREVSGRRREEKQNSPYSYDSVHLFQLVLKESRCIGRAGGALDVQTVPLVSLEVSAMLACHEFMNTVYLP